jgi:ribosome biogenesis SPOUT family RNA methylase Rps3
LGPKQMTTDTAARVVRHVIVKQIPLESIDWIDEPVIKVNAVEHISMPFRYIKGTDGEPVMPEVRVTIDKLV